MIEEESAEFPKIVGNMVVLSRDPSSGYKLHCSCGHEFDYIPEHTNFIISWDKGKVRKCYALCPECRTLWMEDAQFLNRNKPLKFAYYIGSDTGMAKIAGIGSATSRAEALSMAANHLREDRLEWRTFIALVLTDEEAVKIDQSIEQGRRAVGMSILASLLGKGDDGGGEHRT